LEKEPRKASEILLELEAKIDVLTSIVRTQDLNIKILSNKVNSLLELEKSDKVTSSSIKIEAVDTIPSKINSEFLERQVLINPNSQLPQEQEPKGFRRTSRPETYAGDNSYLKSPVVSNSRISEDFTKLQEPEVVVPKEAMNFTEVPVPLKKDKLSSSTTIVPVVQRIVDKNGKSVFLADVEILLMENKQSISKTRTNGAGKWMASLPIGQYRIFVRKRESINKEKLEVMQDIQVDGTQSPLELKTMIIKS